MDEEFQSLIVTNPDLVDEGIDVSGLRTQTDTSPYLLGNIPDYSGIQYSTLAPTKYTDLMRLYSEGLPTLDIPQAATPPSGGGGGGSGGGGQATVPGAIDTLVTPPANTPEEQKLIDEGIGLQIAPGDPVVAPGEIPVTQEEIDAFNQIPVTQPVTGGITGDPVQVEDLINYQFGDDAGSADPTGLDMSGTMEGAPVVFDINQKGDPALNPGSKMVQGDDPYGTVTEEDLADNTGLLQRLGLPADFDIKRAALEAGINFAVGVPITLLARGLGIGLDALGNIIPSGISTTTNKARESGLLVGDTTVTQDKYGINTQSQFGDYNQYNVDRVDELEEIVADQTSRGLTDTIQMKELADRKNYLKVSGADGDIDERDQMLEDISLQNRAQAEADAIRLRNLTGDVDFDTTPTGVTQPFDADTFDDDVTLTSTPPTGTITPLEDDFEFTTTLPPDRTTGPIKLSDMSREEMMEFANELPGTEGLDLIQAYNDLQEYESDLEEIGKDADYIGYTEQEKADIAAGKKTPELGELIDFGLDSVSGDTTPVDEFSDEEFMVGDTSTAAPTTGESGVDSFFDAVDTVTGGGGGRDRDPDPSPSFDPGQGFVDQGGGGEFEGTTGAPVSTAGQAGPPSQRGGGGDDGGGDKGGGGCVIATHAVNSGAFTKDTKREAVRWCVKNLHRTWWGEAVRKGYRYYGQKAIEQGKAKNHYQEFKNYVAFGTGKRRTLKTGWTFVYRTVQFFLKGLTL
jgi:hypothetical protein